MTPVVITLSNSKPTSLSTGVELADVIGPVPGHDNTLLLFFNGSSISGPAFTVPGDQVAAFDEGSRWQLSLTMIQEEDQ